MSHAHDHRPDRRIGTMVGPYLVESVLGVGGMGRVYRATGPDGVAVALKLVKADLAGDHVFRRRFEREARIARTIVHPHVVPVTDTGEHEGAPYLVQRLIEGGTLDDRLKARGVLDLATAVRLCSQVASGLDALYAAGLVHRDIKPANVLLDGRGDAYITDFGLAKDTRGTVLTRVGVIPGTCDYMAPEQIRADTLTAATDVYALGCVLFECLAGAPPFADRHGWQTILQAHLQDDPPDPCAGRTDLPREISAVVRAALEKDPKKRPETASDFARMLRSAAGGGFAGVRQRPSFPT